MRGFGRQFIVFSMLLSLPWNLCNTALKTSLQWIKSNILWSKWMMHYALLDSQLLLDYQDLFGSMRGVILSDCKEELDEVFGEKYRKEWWATKVRLFFFGIVFETTNNVVYFSVMMMIMMSSLLEMQFYLNGKSKKRLEHAYAFSPTWHPSWLHGIT